MLEFSVFSDRRRPLVDISESEVDRRALLQKDWTRYRWSLVRMEHQQLMTARSAQQRALNLLSETVPHLYQAAIQPDASESVNPLTMPLRLSGPYTTPPPQNNEEYYEAPDGEIIDTTPTFQYDFELDRRLMSEVKKGKFVLVRAAPTKT